MQPDRPSTRARLDELYRAESRRVLATLIRLVGDFDLAEEALHEAFAAALERWPIDGEPANPIPWLVSTGRFRAVVALRRRASFDASLSVLAERLDVARKSSGGSTAEHAAAELTATNARMHVDDVVPDDHLRLIFVCCHPRLPPEARVALTLREVCGLTTEDIARAFLVGASTIAQRIVRAKSKIRDERLPYDLPTPTELPERLDSVLQVVYLVFNEGYAASSGDSLTRQSLSEEAIRLGRLLVDLLPEPEAVGLLALMLLHESRRDARTSIQGDMILLEQQDRSRWNRARIREGCELVERALSSRRFGPYTLQAAIAAVHAESSTPASTDWAQIAGLYDVLLRVEPSPVVELNRAVAVAMRDGPLVGLRLVDELLARGELVDYRFAHATRADFLRRLGRWTEARAAYQAALQRTHQEPERRFLERRLHDLGPTLERPAE